jgi:hypothetical protein
MIKHEGNLIVITAQGSNSTGGEGDPNIPNEEKLLKLHPSFNL